MKDPRVVDAERLLDALAPADAREAAARDATLALLASAGSRAFDRAHTSPGHLTASALVTSPDADAVLLVHHVALGLWLQPGGHVEPDDPDLLRAALREVEEETGLCALVPAVPLLDLDVHPIPARGAVPPHLHHDVRFHLVAPSLVARAGDGVHAARWVRPADLPDLRTDASVRRAVARVLSRTRA